LPQRGDEPELVQNGRPQLVGNAPDVADGGADAGLQLFQQTFGTGEIVAHQIARRRSGQPQGCESWCQFVVQVTSKAPPLFFPRQHQSFARLLELSGEADAVNGGSGVACQIVQQTPVRRAPRLTWSASADPQLANELALVRQG